MHDKNLSFFLDFPACSLGLNPIENIFDIIDGELAKMMIKDPPATPDITTQRFRALAKRISNTQNYVKNAIESIPDRLAAVIAANGGPTKY